MGHRNRGVAISENDPVLRKSGNERIIGWIC
jgi:hypothetical protein